MPQPRLIAIGDIHGCSTALDAILAAIRPEPVDTIVTLGDYVDRGLDSKGVLDRLIELRQRCHLVPLLGNHEEMMLGARQGKGDFQFWMNCGGQTTLDSYGDTSRLDQVPESHFRFLEECLDFYETDEYFFVHANYDPSKEVAEQDSKTRLWLSLKDQTPRPHRSGKTVIVGHTPQSNQVILDLGYLKCLDTGCGHGGLLTALDVHGQRQWQVDELGRSVG
jgi:serine/threonine protein phosphatase 1